MRYCDRKVSTQEKRMAIKKRSSSTLKDLSPRKKLSKIYPSQNVTSANQRYDIQSLRSKSATQLQELAHST